MSQKKSKIEKVIEIFQEADPNECKMLLEVARAIAKEKIDSLRHGPVLQVKTKSSAAAQVKAGCQCSYDYKRQLRIVNSVCKYQHNDTGWTPQWPESPDFKFEGGKEK